MKWEYDYDYAYIGIFSKERTVTRDNVLKKRGYDGWELVAVVQDNPNYHLFYWKRPLKIIKES